LRHVAAMRVNQVARLYHAVRDAIALVEAGKEHLSDVAWQVREVSVADVLFDLNILNRKVRNLPVDPFGGPVFVPAACSHFCLLLHCHCTFQLQKIASA
jgi:hypothetical protein